MKFSQFNVINEFEDGAMIYNLNSGGILHLNKQYQNALEKMQKNNEFIEPEDLVAALKQGKMLIDCHIDEVSELLFESEKLRCHNEISSVTIAPTMACNFICPYCYEKGAKYETMNETVIRNTKSFMTGLKKNTDKLEITWYGGEPLLAFEIIKELSLEAMAIFGEENYGANIVTNGYLLDGKVSNWIEKLKINNIQITLDGPPEIHNKRRKLPNGEDTFFVILENIRQIVYDNIKVHFVIRINTDKENIKYINNILLYIEQYGLKGKVDLYLAPVHEMGAKCNNPVCFSNKEFANEEFEFMKDNLKRGYNFIDLPEKNVGICGAVANYCFVVNAQGDIFKCLSEISKPSCSIGNVATGIAHQNKNLRKWLDYQVNTECLTCSYLPVCMGGCPAYQLNDNKRNCISIKENCKKIMELLYRNQI